MLDPELVEAREKLLRRASLYRKYKNPDTAVWLVGFFSVMALMIFSRALSQYLPIGLLKEEPYNLIFIFIIPILLMSLLSKVLSDKAALYRMTHEEWLFLDICSALDDLDAYFKAELEPDRDKAAKKIRKIVKEVEEEWGVGGLRLAKELIGKHVILFKRNLEEKLLSAIEEGDEENLRKSYDFLKKFAKYLLNPNPTVNGLEQINNSLSTMTIIPSERLTVKAKVLTPLKTHPKLQHTLALIGCGAGGVLAFLTGYYCLGIPKETSYSAGLGFTGVLIIAYVNYAIRVRKQ